MKASRVYRLFSERANAPGAPGGPGVDEGGLDDVVAARAAVDVAASVGNDSLDVGPVVEIPGELGERPFDGLDDGRVHLDGRDVGRAAGKGGQHVAAATGADDQGLRLVDQMIGDGRQIGARKNCMVARSPLKLWMGVPATASIRSRA